MESSPIETSNLVKYGGILFDVFVRLVALPSEPVMLYIRSVINPCSPVGKYSPCLTPAPPNIAYGSGSFSTKIVVDFHLVLNQASLVLVGTYVTSYGVIATLAILLTM
jgi:hypothetical protein